MNTCQCGCGLRARTPQGFNSRTCAIRVTNRRRVERAKMRRGQPPICAYCQVNRVKWHASKRRWCIYCDKTCSMSARYVHASPEQRAKNTAHLYKYVVERRIARVRHLVEEALQGRDSLTAAEAYALADKADQNGRVRGYIGRVRGEQKRLADEAWAQVSAGQEAAND